jgi:hypothetical protein
MFVEQERRDIESCRNKGPEFTADLVKIPGEDPW